MLNIPDTEIKEGQFNLLLDNFEGPIDLLLVLARSQKVDLSDISISELADQYINFINQYRNCLLYTSPSPRDLSTSRMPSSA